MTLLKRIIDTVAGVFENSAKNRTAKELLALTDLQLKDIGLCRIKLHKGASAYPWRITQSSVVIDLASKSSSVSKELPKELAA